MSRPSLASLLAHGSAVLWTVAAALLLLAPSDGIPSWPGVGGLLNLPRADWLGHAALFAIGALALHRSLRAAGAGRPLLTAVTTVIVYGLALEGAQRFVPGRLTELADGVANAAGACVYAGCCFRRG